MAPDSRSIFGLRFRRTKTSSSIIRLLTTHDVELDDAANASGAVRISNPASKVSVWVIPTNEDLMIARHTWHLTEGDVKKK